MQRELPETSSARSLPAGEQDDESRFRRLLQRMKFGLVVHAPDTSILFSNAEASRILGLSIEQMTGRAVPDPAWRFVREDGTTMPIEEYPAQRVLATLQPVEEYIVGVDRCAGDRVWGLVRAYPEFGPNDELTSIVVTFDDVTQRVQAEHALLEADRRKNEFLGVLSHELRNPLAAIHNGLYVLERAAAGSEQARRAREAIGRQATQLTRLIDDLLDLTRIERGKIQLKRARLQLRELVVHTMEDLRPEFEANGLDLVAQFGAEPFWTTGDRVRIAQVIGNLLTNAAKFTPRGGNVAVSLEREGEMAVLRVRDTGVGIGPELLGKIFEPFAQAQQTLARSHGGLGLGLALVKGLVELHGGSIRAASDGPGRGAELTVYLPLDQAVQPDAPISTEGLIPAVSRHRVLVIEDNEDVAETLMAALELDGHEVHVAHDGHTGIAMARASTPDVVFCDVGLPEMSGYEVARAFRADEHLRDSVLVAVTGYALPDDRRRCAEAGFDHHLAKPVDLSQLHRLLGELPGTSCSGSPTSERS